MRSERSDLRSDKPDLRSGRSDLRFKRQDLSGENCPVWNLRSSAPPGPLPKRGVD